MFEQCAREVLRLIDDDVRICPERIIKFCLKEVFKITQYRRQRKVSIRHQLLCQRALIVNRNVRIPAAGAQTL